MAFKNVPPGTSVSIVSGRSWLDRSVPAGTVLGLLSVPEGTFSQVPSVPSGTLVDSGDFASALGFYGLVLKVGRTR